MHAVVGADQARLQSEDVAQRLDKKPHAQNHQPPDSGTRLADFSQVIAQQPEQKPDQRQNKNPMRLFIVFEPDPRRLNDGGQIDRQQPGGEQLDRK